MNDTTAHAPGRSIDTADLKERVIDALVAAIKKVLEVFG